MRFRLTGAVEVTLNRGLEGLIHPIRQGASSSDGLDVPATTGEAMDSGDAVRPDGVWTADAWTGHEQGAVQDGPTDDSEQSRGQREFPRNQDASPDQGVSRNAEVGASASSRRALMAEAALRRLSLTEPVSDPLWLGDGNTDDVYVI